jgi:hypothetical protein
MAMRQPAAAFEGDGMRGAPDEVGASPRPNESLGAGRDLTEFVTAARAMRALGRAGSDQVSAVAAHGCTADAWDTAPTWLLRDRQEPTPPLNTTSVTVRYRALAVPAVSVADWFTRSSPAGYTEGVLTSYGLRTVTGTGGSRTGSP